VEFYREKCLQCHDRSGFATEHHPENRDCVACHMGRAAAGDIAHEQVTDHWIRRLPEEHSNAKASTGLLAVVGIEVAGDREFGLAYAQLAARGDRSAASRALELLKRAEKGSGSSGDPELHAQIGFLEQVQGHAMAAAEEYRAALRADEYDELAAGDLALIEAQQHRYSGAAAHWSGVFKRDPVEAGAGMNLATLQCGSGMREAAVRTLERVLQFAPDEDRARTMQEEIRTGTQRCVETQKR
jgi:tetratricopeptide (TPR) repeat protein